MRMSVRKRENGGGGPMSANERIYPLPATGRQLDLLGMKTYLKFWKNAFRFKGRSTRAEYWVPFTVNVGALVTLAVVTYVRGGNSDDTAFVAGWMMFFFFLPYVAVTVRRLHDCDVPGTWALLMVIGLGHFALWIMSMRPGTRGDNAYGPDPVQAAQNRTQEATAIATSLALALAIAGSSAPVRATGQQDLPTAERHYLPVAFQRLCDGGTLLGFADGQHGLTIREIRATKYTCRGEFAVGPVTYVFDIIGRSAAWADSAVITAKIPTGVTRPKSSEVMLLALESILMNSGRSADPVARGAVERWANFSNKTPGLFTMGQTDLLDWGTAYQVMISFEPH
jgi:uncharacterized membrane protein YhaH (DUF805 family)